MLVFSRGCCLTQRFASGIRAQYLFSFEVLRHEQWNGYGRTETMCGLEYERGRILFTAPDEWATITKKSISRLVDFIREQARSDFDATAVEIAFFP
jgi:hypothetical protein